MKFLWNYFLYFRDLLTWFCGLQWQELQLQLEKHLQKFSDPLHRPFCIRYKHVATLLLEIVSQTPWQKPNPLGYVHHILEQRLVLFWSEINFFVTFIWFFSKNWWNSSDPEKIVHEMPKTYQISQINKMVLTFLDCHSVWQ